VRILTGILALMLVVIFNPADAREALFKVLPEDISCEADADCAIVMDSCGGCTCGVSVNTASHRKYEESYQSQCANYQGAHCDFYCPTPFPACVDYRCVLKGRVPKEQILSIASDYLKKIGYDPEGRAIVYDENNEAWRKNWKQKLYIIPEGASGHVPGPDDPQLLEKNYQALYVTGEMSVIWVFVDKDTGRVIKYHEESK
jgi:hypothetical protein